jgi:hypothetical protein
MEYSVADLATIVIAALRDADYQESTITNHQKTLAMSSSGFRRGSFSWFPKQPRVQSRIG